MNANKEESNALVFARGDDDDDDDVHVG